MEVVCGCFHVSQPKTDWIENKEFAWQFNRKLNESNFSENFAEPRLNTQLCNSAQYAHIDLHRQGKV